MRLASVSGDNGKRHAPRLTPAMAALRAGIELEDEALDIAVGGLSHAADPYLVR